MTAKTWLPAILTALACAGAASAADGPDRVLLKETFATDTLASFRVEGEVAWAPGRAELGAGARLGKPLAMGRIAEAHVVARLASGPEPHAVYVRLIGESDAAEAGVLVQGGKVVLVNNTGAKEEVPLGASDEDDEWTLRLQVHHGVARARAWRVGRSEPRAWQSARYVGTAAFEPQAFSVLTRQSAGAKLTGLEITSEPMEVLPKEAVMAVSMLNIQARQALEQGRYPEAIRKAREAVAEARRRFGAGSPFNAAALNNLGTILQTAGQYAEARGYLEQALALRREQFGDEHPETATAIDALGVLHLLTGDFPAAKAFVEQALAVRLKVQGPDDADTAHAFDNMGIILKESGDIAAAEPFLRRAVKINDKVRKRNDPERARALYNLGQTLSYLGKYKEARALSEEALAIHLKLFGEDHPNSALCMLNLGLILKELGNLREAQRLDEKAFAILPRAVGDDHLYVVLARHNLGTLYFELGERAKARDHLERAYRSALATGGADHPMTVQVRNSLGTLLLESGNLTEAKPLLESNLQTSLKRVGPKHRQTALCQHNLGVLHYTLGEYKPARSELEQAIAIFEAQEGGPDPSAAESLTVLGQALTATGDLDAARRCLDRSLEIRTKMLDPGHPAVADSLEALGEFHLAKKDFPAARDAFEKALEIARKTMGDDSPRTAGLLASVGWAMFFMDDFKAARRDLEEALAVIEKSNGGADLNTAQLLRYLGSCLVKLADYPMARNHLERALALTEKLLGPEAPETAAVHDALAQLDMELGNYPEARRQAERGLAIRRSHQGDKSPDTWDSYNTLGGVLAATGDFAAARRYFEQALALAEAEGKDSLTVALTLNNLSHLQGQAGDYAAARACQERGLALARKVTGERSVVTALFLNNMAVELDHLGQLGEARKLLEAALEIRRKALAPEHPYTAMTMQNLGLLLAKMHKYEEAAPLLTEAMVILEKNLGDEHPSTASVLASLGLLYERMDQPELALGFHTRAYESRKKSLGPGHPLTVTVLNNIGMHHSLAGDAAKARECYEQGIALLEKGGAKEHPAMGQMLSNLGVLDAGEGRRGPAWEHLRAASTLHARLASRVLASSGEREHAMVVAQWRPNLEILLSLAAKDPDLAAKNGAGLGSAIFDWKGLSGRALLAREQARAASKDPETAALYQKLVRTRRELVRKTFAGPRSGKRQEAAGNDDQQLDALRTEEGALERQIAGRVATYEALLRAERVGPREVASRLGPGEALVEIVKYDAFPIPMPKTSGGVLPERYAALLLWPGGTSGAAPVVKFLPLGDAGREGQPEGIDGAVHAWRAAVQGGVVPDAVAADLYFKVWEPIARALPPGLKALFVAPDGELALVPFEAIRLPDRSYLVESLRVAYVTSGRNLWPRPDPDVVPNPPLIVADPDYDAPHNLDSLPVKPAPTTAVPVAAAGNTLGGLPDPGEVFTARRGGFRRLPGFALEAERVAARLKALRPAWGLEVRNGEQADEAALAQCRSPRVLSIITHGFFLPTLERLTDAGGTRGFDPVLDAAGPSMTLNRGDPLLRSGLALAGANRWRDRAERGISDGLLTAVEVQDLDLRATELVVLSACETGAGDVRVGEGVLGLRRSFQQAGARTVLASLWKVPDAETERLMEAFFQAWLGGRSRSEALTEAQRSLIAELRRDPNPARRSAPPRLWAGFICHGDPG